MKKNKQIKNIVSIIFVSLVFGTMFFGGYNNDDSKTQQVKQQPINKQTKQEILNRPEHEITSGKLSNVILLGDYYKKSNKNWYKYMPSSEQMLNNIPECMKPQTQAIKNYINGYDKIAEYLYDNNDYLRANPTKLYDATKLILDFDYNYYNYDYFKSLFGITEVAMLNELAYNEQLGTTFPPKNTLDVRRVLNSLFTKEEQKDLAKDMLAMYNHSRDNCVQAGFGDEFYDVYWAGLAEGYYTTSQFIMQIGLIGSTIMVYMEYHDEIQDKNKYYSEIVGFIKENKLNKINIKNNSLSNLIVSNILFNYNDNSARARFPVLAGSFSPAIKGYEKYSNYLMKLSKKFTEIEYLNYIYGYMTKNNFFNKKINGNNQAIRECDLFHKHFLKVSITDKLKSKWKYILLSSNFICDNKIDKNTELPNYFNEFKKFYL